MRTTDTVHALFDVNLIAARLEGLEETIISKLIDRAQFCQNRCAYQEGRSGFKGERRSLFHLRLYHQERMDALFGRFVVPEERPFHTRLPKPRRSIARSKTGLYCDDVDVVNVMRPLVCRYLKLLPLLCKRGDDGHYGSSVEHDTYALQAIARRIHFGALYVAESKFRKSPDTFIPLIKEGNVPGIIKKLTRTEVEARILRRIAEKVRAAQEKANPHVRHLIDPEIVVDFYRDTVIPLTKQGEALYLLNRDLSSH